ncbi:MAG: hypothetical protein ACREBU_16320, partial [Nitrososphaera sp.]
MRLNCYSMFNVVVLALLASGCASYTPTLMRLDPSGPNAKKASIGDLTLYVEEYGTPDKSQRGFDTDMAAQGVLPLLVLVENSGQHSYQINTSNIVVRGNTTLKALTSEEAAIMAQRNPVGRALGWSLIVPIISIPVAVAASAIHTSSVNRQIVQDFASKTFREGTLAPNKELSGFLFFEMESGRKD